MDILIAKKWVNNRLTSEDYVVFSLADLFYKGLVPGVPIKDLSFSIQQLDDLDSSNLRNLVYNPLKREVRKKTNYLLSRPYTVSGDDDLSEYLGGCTKLLKDTVQELYTKGEAWWEYEPDNNSPLKFKITLRKAQSVVPHYTDQEETKYDSVGYLWNKVDDNGHVTQFVDFVDSEGRHRFVLSGKGEEKNDLPHATKGGKGITFGRLPFVRLTSDGLYRQIAFLGTMYSDKYLDGCELIEDTAQPVGVIVNATETDTEILKQDIRDTKLVKVEGTGSFSYASRNGDYGSLESFMKLIKSDISDICGTVSREQELNYVTSGRALDRLYVDMDNDAADMGGVLRDALTDFISFVDLETKKNLQKDFKIVFNTDKPTDEQQIIQNINSSKEFLSTRTLLEQHPWVGNVDEELERIRLDSGEEVST